MAKIKIICAHCGKFLQCDERHRGKKTRCPHCKHSVAGPQIPLIVATLVKRRVVKKKLLLVSCVAILAAVAVVVGALIFQPTIIHWPDRRPIGVLILASNYHSSPTNPRGWFNDPSLDVTGTNGAQNFRKALLDYTDRSIAILKRTGAQGVIVWDLEGEEFPHKTTFIGDPRLLGRLAPEMAPVADEFFQRLRSAGFRVGLTVRPQQLVFDDHGQPRQTQMFDIRRTLLEKIDYARTRWDATIFYIDSNDGIWRPDEVWQLRRLAEQRPGILLIPEHHYLPYSAFSAPYVSLRKGNPAQTAGLARKLFPGSFRALDIGDASSDQIALAWQQGDVLLFRAWYWNSDCQQLENFAHKEQ
jgi:hypothetical protein